MGTWYPRPCSCDYKRKISEQYESFTVYPQVLENVWVKDKTAVQYDADVRMRLTRYRSGLEKQDAY